MTGEQKTLTLDGSASPWRRSAQPGCRVSVVYEKQVRIIAEALDALAIEARAMAASIKSETLAASTGLEYYGIVKSQLERVANAPSLSRDTRSKVSAAIRAVVEIYRS